MGAKSIEKERLFKAEIAHILGQSLGRVVSDLTRVGRFRIDCKCRSEIPQYQWYGDVSKVAVVGQIPMIIVRAIGEIPLVMLSLDDFIPLMRGEFGEVP